MAGRTGAVFLTVTALGQPDRLIGASSPAAEKTELHESIMDAGVMKMREVQGLPVAPGKPAVLAPGGYHFMLMHLKQPLNEGDRIPVTLTFEKAGAIQTIALVAKAGAPMPGMAHQHK